MAQIIWCTEPNQILLLISLCNYAQFMEWYGTKNMVFRHVIPFHWIH